MSLTLDDISNDPSLSVNIDNTEANNPKVTAKPKDKYRSNNISNWLTQEKQIDTSMLSPEQQLAFDKYREGENIFITGPGGCGKTKLIQLIAKHANINRQRCRVCAMTGCAAVLLGLKAKTFHSWGGFGLANDSIEKIVDRIMKSPMKKKNWVNTDVLIVDEVSMMSSKLFELFYIISMRIRNPNLLFGGIQVIFSGDFYQLPPIDDDFCFINKNWEGSFKSIVLSKIFRQDNIDWINILNQVREGYMSKKSYKLLKTRVDKPLSDNNMFPTRILPRRFSVDNINNREMKKITGDDIVYELALPSPDNLSSKDKELSNSFSADQKIAEIESMKTNMVCLDKLVLKIGCQVLCICNLDMDSDNQICNGSQGIVVGFCDGGPDVVTTNKLPLVQFNNGEKRIIDYHTWRSEVIPEVGIMQLPLILSWAITIHRAQGLTLESAELDIGDNIFEKGQTYVSLSRVKDIEGVYLTHFNPTKIQVDLRVKDFYEKIKME